MNNRLSDLPAARYGNLCSASALVRRSKLTLRNQVPQPVSKRIAAKSRCPLYKATSPPFLSDRPSGLPTLWPSFMIA
jgi:hypothetical protein